MAESHKGFLLVKRGRLFCKFWPGASQAATWYARGPVAIAGGACLALTRQGAVVWSGCRVALVTVQFGVLKLICGCGVIKALPETAKC